MTELIHYQPNPKNWNVVCGNGSYHAPRTIHINYVTCPLCVKREEKQAKKETNKLISFITKLFTIK